MESWINTKWRPIAAWIYIIINIFDFIIFPMLWSLFQVHYKITPIQYYLPLTIQGGGLFHLAFGAILGVTSWGRSQERISGTSFPRNDFGQNYPRNDVGQNTYYNGNMG